jgi:ribose 5-phosphate isomerase A
MASPRATGRQEPPPLTDAGAIARYKRAAARAAAEMVADGMRVGLGSGSTVAYLLPALGERELRGVACVATSPATARTARELGLAVELDEVGELDLAIDGADQIDPRGWLIKGGGAAHTREKIVAAAARRFVVIASAEKAVAQLRPPVPLELVRFGVQTTLRALGESTLRAPMPSAGEAERAISPPATSTAGEDAGAQRPQPHGCQESPDGGVIADYLGAVVDPRELAARLSATPGVVEHGLFAPEMVSLILIGGESGVERRAGAKPDAAPA